MIFRNLLKMLPKKAVLSTKERAALERLPASSPIVYTSPPLVEFPVIPFQVFATHYEKDIVIVTKHPDWNMHEFSWINFPDGGFWMIKDSREGTLEQVVTTSRENIADLLPEIPLDIAIQAIKITDNSDADWQDISFEYENFNGELVKAHYKGRQKLKDLKKRNGSTMGHSRDHVMAVLDLPKRRFGKKASITYNAKKYPIKKILGIVDFNMMLTQTQAGLSVGKFSLFQNENTIQTRHFTPSETMQNWTWSEGVLQQKNKFRTQKYLFDYEQDSYQLRSISVELWDKKEPAFQISFFPPLPDYRRRFEGVCTAQFVMDVNGQENHGIGQVKSYWKGTQLFIDIIPENPWWLTDRPIRQIIEFKTNEVLIDGQIDCSLID